MRGEVVEQRIDSGSTRFRLFGTWYLPILFTIPAFGSYFHSLAPNENVFKGQDWGIWVAFLLTLLAALSWLSCRDSTRLIPLARAALAFMLAAWIYQVIRIQLDGATFNLTAFLLPLVLVLLALKPPRREAISAAGLALAYSILLVSALSLVFGALGTGPDGFNLTDSGPSRIPILGDLLGIETRWGGPFGSVNYAAPMGGLLVILSFSFKGLNRYLIIGGGLTVLVLSQARSSAFAVIAGLVIIFLWSAPISRLKHRIPLRLIVLIGVVFAYFLYVALFDSSLSGRTIIWSDFGNLWLDRPIFGVGDSGISDFVNSRDSDPAFVPHGHAHSVVFDGLVRFGIPMLILSLGTFITTMAISIRSASHDWGKNLAIVIFVVLAGLAETIHSFSYLSVYMCALLFVVLSSNAILLTSASRSSKNDIRSEESV